MSYFEIVKSQIFRLSFLATLFYCTMVIRHAWDGYRYSIDWQYIGVFTSVFVFGGSIIDWLFPGLQYRDYILPSTRRCTDCDKKIELEEELYDKL